MRPWEPGSAVPRPRSAGTSPSWKPPGSSAGSSASRSGPGSGRRHLGSRDPGDPRIGVHEIRPTGFLGFREPGSPRIGDNSDSPVRTESSDGSFALALGGEDPGPEAVAGSSRRRDARHGRREVRAGVFEPRPTTGQQQPPTPRSIELDPQSLCRRVGFSARAAIVQSAPPRKSQAQQLAELAATRRRREAAAGAARRGKGSFDHVEGADSGATSGCAQSDPRCLTILL